MSEVCDFIFTCTGAEVVRGYIIVFLKSPKHKGLGLIKCTQTCATN